MLWWPVSEPILTPFQSVPIRTPITYLPCLTSISLYRFQYLHSGPTCPFSPCCSLDLVVCLLCFLFQTSLCRYHRPASDLCWTLFVCSFRHVTSLDIFSCTTPFPLWTFISICTYVTFSAILRVSRTISLISRTIPSCLSLMSPLFQIHMCPLLSNS